VAPGTVIGRERNLAQGVTLGVGGTVRRGTPTLGDRVWVGPKTTLSGPLQVGNGAVIGANSLVVSNVPERGVAVGVLARVVALSGSAALID
jgi:serine O-acetyltransferase